MSRLLLFFFVVCIGAPLVAEPLSPDELADNVVPPFVLGDPVNDRGVWTVKNSGGQDAGYVFETEPLAPLPGFPWYLIRLLRTGLLSAILI